MNENGCCVIDAMAIKLAGALDFKNCMVQFAADKGAPVHRVKEFDWTREPAFGGGVFITWTKKKGAV